MIEPFWQHRYIENLQAKLAKRRMNALKRAHARGMQAGQDLCDPLLIAMENLLRHSETFKIDAAVACAEDLVQQHLENNPQVIISMAQKVLKNIPEHADAELSAHPTDAAILACATEITLGNSSRRTIAIIKDESQTRGSLVLKANKSIIDAQVCTQLSRAREVLLS